MVRQPIRSEANSAAANELLVTNYGVLIVDLRQRNLDRIERRTPFESRKGIFRPIAFPNLVRPSFQGGAMFFAILSFSICLILILGGFLCLALGFKLVRSSGKSATTTTEFEASWGEKKFRLGAGSLAALTMTISLGWIAAGIFAKPSIDHDESNNGFRTRIYGTKKQEVEIPSLPAPAEGEDTLETMLTDNPPRSADPPLAIHAIEEPEPRVDGEEIKRRLSSMSAQLAALQEQNETIIQINKSMLAKYELVSDDRSSSPEP